MSETPLSPGRIERAFSPHGMETGPNLGRWPRLVWCRAFSPHEFVTGMNLGRCPRLVSQRAVGPETLPDAFGRETLSDVIGPEIFRANGAFHTSLGHRPRYPIHPLFEG